MFIKIDAVAWSRGLHSLRIVRAGAGVYQAKVSGCKKPVGFGRSMDAARSCHRIGNGHAFGLWG